MFLKAETGLARRTREVLRILAVAAVYFGAARLGLLLASVHGSVSPVWPASGIALSALLLGGRRLWPAVFLGALAANLLTEAPRLAVLAIAAGNTLEALGGAWLWRAAQRRWSGLGDFRELVGAVAAASFAPIVSASLGVGALLATGGMAPPAAQTLWLTWWAGDALGVLALTPAVLAMAALEREPFLVTRGFAGKAALLLGTCAGVCWLAFVHKGGAPFLFALFPVVLLGTTWFGAPGAKLMALLISAAGIAAAFAGHGPFVADNLNQNLLNLQAFLATVAITALALPAFRVDRGAMLLPVGVLLAGWLVSGWLFNALHRDQQRREQEFFDARVAEAMIQMRVRFDNSADALRGGASYFAASEAVGRAEWRMYTESLRLAERYPGMNGIGVIFPVPLADTARWLEWVRQDGVPDFSIRPFPATTDVPGGPQYVITYLEPVETASGSLGRNIATEPSRREAAEAARDSGEPRFHHRLDQSRDLQRRSGLLLYLPLYAKNLPRSTVEERRAAHEGWLYAQIFPDLMFAGVLGGSAGVIELHCFDAAGLVRERLLYGSSPLPPTGLPVFERVTHLEVGGERFQLGWRRGPKFPVMERVAGMWSATSFTLATLLLAGLVMSLQTMGRQAHAIAAKRTAELAASEARLTLALDAYRVGVWEWEPATGFVHWDERMFALYGLPGPPAGTITYATWRETVSPEDVEAQERQLQATVAARGRGRREFRIRRASDGAVRTILAAERVVTGSPTDPLRVVGVNTDITEQKAAEAALRDSEERFRHAFEFAGIGMAIVGLDGRWLRVNQGLCEIVGYTEEALREKSFQDLTHPEDLAAALEHRQQLLEGTRRSYQMEQRYFHRNGTVVWVLLTGSLVRDAANAPRYFIAQVQDITERKQLETSLARARDEALEASRLKSAFLANMSHEIRTPMNAVISMSALLAETPLSTEQRPMLRLVQDGAESLLKIIDDILDLAKIEAGKIRLEHSDFDLRAIVEDTVAFLAPRANEKQLRLTSNIALGGALELHGDGGRVRQILTNLVGNALKFTSRGEVFVGATILRASLTHVRFKLVVRDTGPGIPQEAQARLFAPFVQVHATGTARPGGTGLGLAISRQLAEAMGGSIGLESQPGVGSSFWLELELPRAAGRHAPRPRAIPTRVLVVDDYEDDRLWVRRELTRAGIGVEGVADGPAALAWLRAKAAVGESLPLVLIDWHLGGMTGLQLSSAIREDPALSSTRMVLTSGGPLADPTVPAAAGFEKFLRKPVQLAEVLACLEAQGQIGEDSGALVRGAGVGETFARVLVVEDNPANRVVARLLLEKLGCAVDVTGDGQQAIAAMSDRRYDAVLMDCQMPVLDGYEATRRIRTGDTAATPAQVPIIAVTAYAMRDDRAKCLAAGMNDYITKPIRLEELRSALERCGLRALATLQAALPRLDAGAAASVAALDTRTVGRLRALPGARGSSLLPELIAAFLAREAATLAEISSRAAQRDRAAVAERAHAFAGEAAVLGGFAVRDAALALERAARDGGPTELPPRLANLRAEAARLRRALAAVQISNS